MSTRIHSLRNHLAAILLSALVWMVITRGNPESWIIGVPAIVFAVYASGRMDHRRHGSGKIHFSVLPGLILWFLWSSLRGGLDVAWRVMQPKLPLQPGFVRYRLSIKKEQQRLFLLNMVSMLPGTLSADLQEDELVLHALNREDNILAETREAEVRVARLYGLPVVDRHD